MSPSLLHEGLIEMVRERPTIVADLLAGPLGVKVPPFKTARLSLNDLTEATPIEFRADQVVTLHDDQDDPTLAVVLEVQLKSDERKRRSWPVYFATTHARLKCPVSLLVVCPTEAVADWVADPIRIGDPGMVLTPIALGPNQAIRITDPDQARNNPEQAVLSALSHANGDDPEPVIKAFVAALSKFDLDHAKLYTFMVANALSGAAQRCLEEIMTTAAERDHTSLRELFPTTWARSHAEGKAEGKAEAVLAILTARRVDVSDEVRDRITSCTDDEQLDAWVHRAVLANGTDELFV